MSHKQKTISIKFFLNKDVKVQESEIDGAALYPVYVRVTYNRRNTKFRIQEWWYKEEFEGHLEELPEFKDTKVIIEQIVRFESDTLGEKYSVRGLADRYCVYTSRISKLLEHALILNISQELGNILTFNEFSSWQKLELGEKISYGLNKLKPEIPIGIYRLSLLFALVGHKTEATIFDWVIGDLRKGFLIHLDDLIKLSKKEEKDIYAFDIIPLDMRDPELVKKVIPELIDSFCSEVLSKSYSESFNIGSISIDTKEKKVIIHSNK